MPGFRKITFFTTTYLRFPVRAAVGERGGQCGGGGFQHRGVVRGLCLVDDFQRINKPGDGALDFALEFRVPFLRGLRLRGGGVVNVLPGCRFKHMRGVRDVTRTHLRHDVAYVRVHHRVVKGTITHGAFALSCGGCGESMGWGEGGQRYSRKFDRQ